jgi:hypothetical protein
MKNKKYILGGLLGLLVLFIIVGAYVWMPSQDSITIQVPDQMVSTETPVNIVLDFYGAWLDAAKSTSTNPYILELHAQPILGEGLRTRLASTQNNEAGTLDPVLCQTIVPEHITGRKVFEIENRAQILVMARDKTVFNQALVTLMRHNDGWYIDDITCSPGEFAPVLEFTFEKEGYLLKNVPPPLDSQYWYIIFTENNEQGHSAPLFFNEKSVCQSIENVETVCDSTQFIEGTKIYMYGQMTERGVEVERLKYVQ